MCGVAEAQLALAVVGTVAKHQNEKAIAREMKPLMKLLWVILMKPI